MAFKEGIPKGVWKGGENGYFRELGSTGPKITMSRLSLAQP